MRAYVGLSTLLVATVALLAAGMAASYTPVDALPAAPGAYRGPTAIPTGTQLFADDVHKQCGDYALVFRNPDLREDENDFIHAQGQFFIQFQAVGSGSSEVVRFSFSFGVTQDALHDNPTLNCNEALPDSQFGKGTAGAYLMYYRSDFDPSDGFFVPILTNNVPDGEYAAAVHAYNAQGNEVARAWARAIVENCPSELTGPNQCPQSTVDDVVAQDHIVPWPMVLPGDGAQTNDVAGLTVEFAEPIKPETLQVSVNGRPVSMGDWENPLRDTDLAPLNDEDECPGGQQIRLVCQRDRYGPGFKWEGNVREGDIVRVSAQDANGNLGVKTSHFGAATSGGTVDLELPEVELFVLNGDTIDVRPGDFHVFNFRADNIGGSDSHTNLLAEVPRDEEGNNVGGLQATWTDGEGNPIDHVVVPAGGQAYAQLKIQTTANTPAEAYALEAVAEYDVGGQQSYKRVPLSVQVDPNAAGGHHQLHGEGIPANTTAPLNETASPLDIVEKGKSPGLGVVVLLAAAVAVAGVFGRRRN